MRPLLALALLVPLAGCLSDPPQPEAAADGPVAQGPEMQRATVEGRYSSFQPLGEPVREEGGRATLDVAGWHDVMVTLDSTIEVRLWLLPPGCAAVQDACALEYTPEDAGSDRWIVPSMQAGAWTVAVQGGTSDQIYISGDYRVDFSYHLD